MDLGIILLAAGSSSRMGTSKLLLDIHGVPLLTYIATIALQSGIGEVVVVLGANESEHRNAVGHIPVDIVFNPHWERGMGGSIKVGLQHFMARKPSLSSILVMVCDQPLLTSEHLKKLNEKFINSRKPIVASSYSDTSGVPAIFEKSLFTEILSMSDEQGARKIIVAHPDKTINIEFKDGSVDLDTPEDYRHFMK